MRAIRMVPVLVCVSLAAGCGFTGVADQPLPLTKGSGKDAIHATVYLADAANLVPNAEVKVNDITVGSVRKVTFDHWRAKVAISLEPGTHVPANATAAVAQKSLLGAEYLELAAPTAESGEPTTGALLGDGDVVPLERTSRYPETEEVLSSLSLVLNGGGIEKVSTITRELNLALGGRETDWRRLIKELGTFVGILDQQKQDIVRALDGLNALSRTFAEQRDDLDSALERLPAGIDTLADQRKQLTATLTALAKFSDTASGVIETSGEDLDANLTSLRPALTQLANAGSDLTGALGDLSFPFPLKGANVAIQGDYLNFFATFDLTTETLTRDFLAGTPLEGVYAGLTGSVPSSTSAKASDPVLDPLKGATSSDASKEAPTIKLPDLRLPEVADAAPQKDGGLIGRLLNGLLGGSDG